MIIAHVKIEGQCEVIWKFYKSKNTHKVIYGKQIAEFSGRDYGEIKALHEFGECVAHAAACNRMLNV